MRGFNVMNKEDVLKDIRKMQMKYGFDNVDVNDLGKGDYNQKAEMIYKLLRNTFNPTETTNFMETVVAVILDEAVKKKDHDRYMEEFNQNVMIKLKILEAQDND